MNIQIISDIHGNAKSLENTLNTPYKVDAYILLGDYLNHGPRNPILDEYDPIKVSKLLNKIDKPIISVRGNCDSEVDQMLLEFPMMQDESYFLNENILIYITHGHLFDPQEDYKKKKAKIYMSGHTHIAHITKINDSIIYNPGSISLPKGSIASTYGMIQDNELQICDVQTHEIIERIQI